MYEELKSASIEDRIGAAEKYFREHTENVEFANGLAFAKKLVQADGWCELAPIWMREYKQF